jgi:hypothetical protein
MVVERLFTKDRIKKAGELHKWIRKFIKDNNKELTPTEFDKLTQIEITLDLVFR